MSGTISLEGVSKQFPGGVLAVDDLSLEVEPGEFLVLVGPSGCGKTTALRMVAGLEPVTGGEIRINDRVVTRLPPRDRDIAMVFQNYALYAHMTVRNNMAFGLKMAGTPKAEIRTPGGRGGGDARPDRAARPQAARSSPAASASGWRWAARSSASRPRS